MQQTEADEKQSKSGKRLFTVKIIGNFSFLVSDE
jgi:hypothetical protein